MDTFIPPLTIGGWVRRSASAPPANVRLLLDGKEIARAMADHGRADHLDGFMIDLPLGVDPRILAFGSGVVRTENGTSLPVHDAFLVRFYPGLEVHCGDIGNGELFIVGREGYVFVYKGVNRLVEQYSMSQESVETLRKRWLLLLDARQKQCDAIGSKYLQIFIPEKSSVMPHLAPFEAGPLPAYRSLMAALQERPNVIDALTLFDQDLRRRVYRPANSHLTIRGALTIFSRILEMMGHNVPDEPEIVASVAVDVYTSTFFGVPIADVWERCQSPELSRQQKGLAITFEKSVPPNHVGTIVRFANSTAPIQQTAIAFGNSFFGSGSYPADLTWWFARFFAEFHFIWSPGFDYGEIERIKPDWVIGQTIERFLIAVPGD